MKLNAEKLSLAAAIVSSVCMLLLSILNGVGLYQSAVSQMEAWHMFYTPTFLVTFIGMIEAFVITYICVYAVTWLYNYLISEKK